MYIIMRYQCYPGRVIFSAVTNACEHNNSFCSLFGVLFCTPYSIMSSDKWFDSFCKIRCILSLILNECGHLQITHLLTLYTHFIVSATPGNIAGNHFLKALLVLSYYFECLQVTESEIFLMRFIVSGIWESLNRNNSGDFSGRFSIGTCFGQKIALLKVLCGKVCCHDTKFTCLAKDCIFFDECTAINIPKLYGSLFVLQGHICNW
jgi:hypothetical protein